MKNLVTALTFMVFSIFISNIALAQQTTFRINYDVSLFDIPVASTEALTQNNYVFSGTHAFSSSVVEVDAIGNLVWGKSFSGYTFGDLKRDDASNRYLVCGGGTSSSSPALLMFLDASGNTVSARNFSISQANGAFFNRAIKTSDGGYVAVGYVTGYDPDGAGSEVKFSNQTNNDSGCSESSTETISSPLIVKFDNTGAHLWHRVFRYYSGSASPANSIYNDGSFVDVAEVSDGYVTVGNYDVNDVFSDFDPDECDDETPKDAMILKTTTTGAITYHRQLDNPSTSTSQDSKTFASITVTSSGLPLVSGNDNDGRPTLLMRLSGSGGWSNPSWIRKFDRGSFIVDYNPFFPSRFFETSDGNYAFWANYLTIFPPSFSNALVKINPNNNSVIWAKEYEFNFASFLPHGEQVSDGGFIGVSYTLAGTGHDIHIIKTDEDGEGPVDCTAPDLSVGSGSVSYTYGTPIYNSWNANTVSNTSTSPVGVTTTPSASIDCRTIVCNAPPVPTASANNNNFCPGGSVTISASGSGANTTYEIFDQASGGNSLGNAPQTFTPSTTTTYYVEAYNNSDPLCVTARDSVTVTVLPPPPAQPGTISGDNPACPSTSETYSISSVNGATSYNWSLNGGGNISGTGTSANVNWGSTPGTYTISVTAENSCGTSNARTLQVTVGDPPPAQPSSISGASNPCPGSQNYSIGSVAGATSYNWSVSGGGNISGSGTSINVNWTTSGGPYTLSVTAVNNCGNSAVRALQVNVKDAAPSSIGGISGDTPVCFGTENYSVSSVPRATNYDWSLNGGGSITSGQGSNSININWTSAGTHTISVFAENDCGQTSTETLQVTVDSPPPAQPGNITGEIAPCPGTENYSIASVSGATNYTWTLSGGGSISNGQGGTAIDIDWTTSGGPYTLSVVAENSCGNSSARTIQVNVGDPAPSSIDTIGGDNLVCPGNATYTIPTVSGATNYDWTISGGGSISSGQGTNSIVVNWTTQGNYTVSVTAENSCGDISSTPKNVEVLSGVPATPSISGPVGVCPGTETYSIAAVSGASGYSWSLSGGGNIISGTGTNSIDVDWGATNGTYTLSVTADNICGSSNTATLQVNVTSGPPSGLPSIAGSNPTCPGSEAYTASGVTGASTYTWSVDAGGTITSGQGTSNINIDWTNSGGPFTIEVFTENSCGYGDTNTIAVFVDSLPQFDGDTIVGEINPCPGSENYSIASVANATGYNWTVSSGGTINSGQGTNSISVDWTTSGGPYTLSVVPTNDCGDGTAVTQNITVQPGPPTTPTSITGETTVCEGAGTETYTIPAVAGASNYVWTMLNGGGSIVSGQGTTSIDIDWTGSPGNYQFSVRAENNCGFSADIFHSVNIIAGAPNQPVAINGPIEICPGTENYSIASVQDASSYNWALNAGGNIVSGQGTENISVNWIASGGPYTLSVIAENTCGSSIAQTLDVTVLQSPTAPSITTSGDSICEGSNTTITASGSTGGTITYGIYDDQTGGNFLGNSPLEVNPENTTTYYVQASNQSGCTYAGGRVPVEIVVLPAPSAASISADNQSVCSGDSATFTATTSGSSISWWSTEDGGTLLGTGTEFNTGSVTQSTTYYVSTTSANGCEQISDRTAVNVNVRELPFLSLGTDAESNSIFINEALTAIADPDYYDLYEFFLNGGSVQNDSIHTWAASTFEDGDVISVISTDAGCVGNEAEVTITVNDYPNAFTPNGDGRNDVFLEGFDLTIINRWGQELYQGTDGWDGTFNGTRVAPGTYFYILKVQDITDTENVLKGSVLVNN